MPQSLKARATLLKPQANSRRSDWSSPDRRHQIGPVQIIVGDQSSPDCRRRSSLTLIGDRSSLPQRPQPSSLPARLLRCSLPQGISFYTLTCLSFFLSDSLSISHSLSLSLSI